MKNQETSEAVPDRLRSIRRKAVSISEDNLVSVGYLKPEILLPLVIQPAMTGINLVDWARNRRELIEAYLLKHGAILFRNFKVTAADEFEQFITVSSEKPFAYTERSSPRSQVSGNIYSSTDYPADQRIFMHNENSYAHTWPLKIFFCCSTAAHSGGETPLADTRKVFQRIDARIRDRFLQKKVMYVRNFGTRLGLSWQTVFQTTDRVMVNDYCRHAGYEVEWEDNNHLRTRRVGQAIARHPRTGEMVWFNHAAFFHITTLEPEMREVLLAELRQEDLPNNTYYGDGSPIEPSVLDELREAYQKETVTFQWQEGDVLMLDNMLTAHGREPFIGPRKIWVGMSEPFDSEKDEREGTAA
jgi:alpha-ketoglutarate-dependent taurine dioxygenase